MKLLVRFFFISVLITLIFTSCKKKDEKICSKSNCTLSFDLDTVVFDTTVFTGVKTITKRLRVFNNNENAVEISEISIPKDSPFKLIINGERKNSMKNITLRGENRLLILIEAVFNENENDSINIIEEDLKFVTNGEEQNVLLVAPTQNVYFHNDEVLPCNTIWKSDKPHLIYNSVLVEEGCKLTIEAGTKIYSAARSAIFVFGSIEAIGTFEEPIIFTDARLDEGSTNYNDIFGIWEGIFLLPGSENHTFKWIQLNNAVNGIYANTNSPDGIVDLLVSHSIINTIGSNSNAPSFTMLELGLPSGNGILAANMDVLVYNCLITNCTYNSVYSVLGGTHTYINNTLTNYPNATINTSYNRDKDLRTFVAYTTTDDIVGGNMTLKLTNNIIYGENSATEDEDNLDEFALLATDNFQFEELIISNNIIKTAEFDSILNTINITNENPFESSFPSSRTESYDFTLQENSNAIDAGFPEDITGIDDLSQDLAGNYRDAFWDIGAYEYAP